MAEEEVAGPSGSAGDQAGADLADAEAGPIVAPYGSWRSPISIEMLAAAGRGLGVAHVEDGFLWWLEGRPEDAGRVTLVRQVPGSEPEDMSPAGMNVRSRVHEYGGGSVLIDGDLVVVSDFATGRLHRLLPGRASEPITPDRQWRYADADHDARNRRLLAVREDHESGGEHVNELVAIPLDGGEQVVIATGRDFYAAPRLAPDGDRLAWLEWDHPNMPWDGTELRLADVRPDGSIGEPVTVYGDASTWVSQPRWSPDGELWFVAEPGQWANLHRLGHDGRVEPVAAMAAEFTAPDWQFGQRTFGFLPDGRVLAVARSAGRDRLFAIDRATGAAREIPLPFTEIEHLEIEGGAAWFLGANAAMRPSIVRLDIADGTTEIVRRGTDAVVDDDYVSPATPVSFPTTGGATAHAIYYPPTNRDYQAPDGELPPLIVTSHGGPTSAAFTGLSFSFQVFASRGFAVVDVDYRGSTGYGKTYRRALERRWGVYDVDDCVAAARSLVERGLVDGARLAIRGASASGYTTLCALAFRDEFAAGATWFGLADLEKFVMDTHKFESRYLVSLVGQYPEEQALYRERSPIHAVDRITKPVIVLQGAEDRVVPPEEAERIVTALAANGVPHAFLLFPGEDHGFRSTESIVRGFGSELSFFAQVFGITLADDIEPVAIEGLQPA
jgi:dipeptidyl aminopeptidase/acylaminoacyl peptidase